ncbi:UNVERIFIED_CONTAM: hypothetical protein FKN15_050231 [Acipenser sinensis]
MRLPRPTPGRVLRRKKVLEWPSPEPRPECPASLSPSPRRGEPERPAPRRGSPSVQRPGLLHTQLGLTPRSHHHQAQLVAWSPAPLPLVAQTSLHGRLGSHLCLGLQPSGRLPVLLSCILSLSQFRLGDTVTEKLLNRTLILQPDLETRSRRAVDAIWRRRASVQYNP